MVKMMVGKFYTYDTPEATNEWTSRAKLHIAGMRERLASIEVDADRAHRLQWHECLWCWYGSCNRISGQAFTKYTCQVCAEEFMHHNTHTPRVCQACAEKLRICVECGADLDLKRRRIAKKASTI